MTEQNEHHHVRSTWYELTIYEIANRIEPRYPDLAQWLRRYPYKPKAFMIASLIEFLLLLLLFLPSQSGPLLRPMDGVGRGPISLQLGRNGKTRNHENEAAAVTHDAAGQAAPASRGEQYHRPKPIDDPRKSAFYNRAGGVGNDAVHGSDGQRGHSSADNGSDASASAAAAGGGAAYDPYATASPQYRAPPVEPGCEDLLSIPSKRDPISGAVTANASSQVGASATGVTRPPFAADGSRNITQSDQMTTIFDRLAPEVMATLEHKISEAAPDVCDAPIVRVRIDQNGRVIDANVDHLQMKPHSDPSLSTSLLELFGGSEPAAKDTQKVRQQLIASLIGSDVKITGDPSRWVQLPVPHSSVDRGVVR